MDQYVPVHLGILEHCVALFVPQIVQLVIITAIVVSCMTCACAIAFLLLYTAYRTACTSLSFMYKSAGRFKASAGYEYNCPLCGSVVLSQRLVSSLLLTLPHTCTREPLPTGF